MAMSFVANQMIGMMVNRIKQNNPKMGRYIDEIQRGGNANQVLGEAIRNGDITRTQFEQAKPLLRRYGSQMGINIQDNDLQALESLFGANRNNTGFRF